MYSTVQKFKLRNLGIALILCTALGLSMCFIPWEKLHLSAPAMDTSFAPYRFLVGFFAGILAVIGSKSEERYYLLLVCSILALVASLILTFIEHFYQMDSLINLSLFLQGAIIYSLLQMIDSQKKWTAIIQTSPRTLDLHIDGKNELFNRMVMSPHLEMNPEILRNVDHFLEIQTDPAPLELCIYSAESISEHLQKVACEAFRMYYQDQEYNIRKFVQSRFSRSIWMMVISIVAFRGMSLWGGQSHSAAFWEILSSFAAFSLWKVGDTYFERYEAMHRLANVLIAKNAEIEFI